MSKSKQEPYDALLQEKLDELRRRFHRDEFQKVLDAQQRARTLSGSVKNGVCIALENGIGIGGTAVLGMAGIYYGKSLFGNSKSTCSMTTTGTMCSGG